MRRRTIGGAKPAWCLDHQDFGWIYGDGSRHCWWESVVESSSEDHVLVPIVVDLPAKAIESLKAEAL